MPGGNDSIRTVTVRRGEPAVFGLRSHIVLIETKDTQSSSDTDFTIEGTAAFAMLVIADIVLLVVSGRFSDLPRELVRWIGGAFLVVAGLFALLLGVLTGLLNCLFPRRQTSKVSPAQSRQGRSWRSAWPHSGWERYSGHPS